MNLKLLTLFSLFIATLSILYAQSSSSQKAPEQYRLAITQIVQHPSLDKIRQGILDELADQGFVQSENLQVLYENAQGNMAIATQIAQHFVGEGADVMVGIATPSAQTLAAANRRIQIPLVFSAVTDPVGAGLLRESQVPAGNLTGTIDLPPVDQQLDFLQKALLNFESLGVVFNPGEINAVNQIDALETEAAKRNISIIKSPVAKSSDISASTKRLVGKVDAIYVANDNMIVAGLESLLQVADRAGVPVMTSDPESVERGANYALANDQYDVGRETGKLVARILKGESARDIPVVKVAQIVTKINDQKVREMNFNIQPEPCSVSKRAILPRL